MHAGLWVTHAIWQTKKSRGYDILQENITQKFKLIDRRVPHVYKNNSNEMID